MIVAIIGTAYICLGLILSFVLMGYMQKKLGEGSNEGVFIIMYLNTLLWPIFFMPMILTVKKESKNNEKNN